MEAKKNSSRKRTRESLGKNCKKLNKSIAEALIDPFFYHYLNDKKIKSIDVLPCIEIEGLVNNSKNQIEIWYQGKKVQKLKINDLNNDFLLFPLYNVSTLKIDNNLTPGIYLEQKEIGLFGSYYINNAPNFNLENLQFEVLKYRDKVLVSKILYKNQPIPLNKKETSINYQFGFTVE